jgi:arylsulfatase A-like enzyme
MKRLTLYIAGILLVGISISGVVLFGKYAAAQKNVCRDCNIILITIDSMDRSHLGLYGYPRATSPNLDAWSKDAFVFDQYITSSDLTPITQTSLQTGRYPSNSGVVSFSSLLPDDVPTLPEILKKDGYVTAAIGSAPEYYAEGVSGWQKRRKSFERGFDQFFDEYFENQIMPVSPTPGSYRWPQQERGIPEGAVGWLKDAPKQKFFLWIPVGTVHWPYNDTKPTHFADPSYDGVFLNDELRWRVPSQFKRVYDKQIWPKEGAPVPISDKDVQFVVDRYDDGIYLTDRFLGDIFKTISDKGLLKNTIVIITTEHGEEFGEHKYLAHYDIFDPEIRVPFIMRIPGISNKRMSSQVSTVDILPTVLDAAGLEKPAVQDGKSFWQYLSGGAAVPDSFRTYAFTERTPLMETLMFDSESADQKWLVDFLVKDGKEHFRDVSVRTKEWKLIYRESRAIQEQYSWWRRLTGDTSPMAEYELYHLIDTALEQKNVIDAQPKVAAQLKKVLQDWIQKGAKRRTLIPPDFEETSIGTFY